MPIIRGSSSKPLSGTLKQVNISPYINEQSINSTAVPSSYVIGNTQATWTYDASVMSPTFTGNTPVLNYRPVLFLNLCGQNISGASATIYWQMNKNGVNWKSGSSSVASNYYFTIFMYDYPVQGDIYDFYIWTSSTNVNYNYKNSYILPSRVDTGANYISNYTTILSTTISTTNFPIANKASTSWNGSVYVYPSTTVTVSFGISGTQSLPFMQNQATYKLFQLQAEGTSVGLNSSSTYILTTQSNSYIASLSYRDLDLM